VGESANLGEKCTRICSFCGIILLGLCIVFLGASSLSLDAKGRLSVPTRHHEALMIICKGQVTITQHYEGCLFVFPQPAWEAFGSKIAALPMSSLRLKRLYLSNAMTVELDGTGRILISPELREAASITKEATLRGMGHYFELWDKTAYEAYDTRQKKSMQEDMPTELNVITF
jgi:MraZ protein